MRNSGPKKLHAFNKSYAQMNTHVAAEEEDALNVERAAMEQNGIYVDPTQEKSSGLARVPLAVVILVVCVVTLIVQGYRLGVAPDVFSDEGVYLLVGTNIAKGLGPVLGGGQGVYLWHPPLYMLIEGVYIKLAGLTNVDALTALLSVRYLNIIFSAITAGLLVLFGRKLHSLKAGLIMAVLFLLDPYVQRINRRNMLETLAMLCVLLGFYFFFTRQARLTKWQRLASGIAFGLALLTKEPMLLELCALIVYVLLFRRSQLRDIVWVTGSACAIYLIYPAWLTSIGQENNFLIYMRFGVQRIIASITNSQTTPAPNITLVSASQDYILNSLWLRLFQYGTSYLLIALVVLFIGILILQLRHLLVARYLIVWGIFSFGFGLVVGHISDQYFYYLVVSSIIIAGYVLALHFDLAFASFPKRVARIQRGRLFSRASIASMYRRMWRPMFAIFVVMFLCNGLVWVKTYAVGTDDAYMQTIRYVQATVPHHTAIEASDDVAVYYLSPPYDILLDRDSQTILGRRARYFIMSSKDAWGGYDAMTPEFYNWIIQNSRPIFVHNDQSFWTVGLYELKVTPIKPLSDARTGAQKKVSVPSSLSARSTNYVPLYPLDVRSLDMYRASRRDV